MCIKKRVRDEVGGFEGGERDGVVSVEEEDRGGGGGGGGERKERKKNKRGIERNRSIERLTITPYCQSDNREVILNCCRHTGYYKKPQRQEAG